MKSEIDGCYLYLTRESWHAGHMQI